MKVFPLDEQTNTKLILFLLKNVKDIKTLGGKIISGQLDCCALKPALIVDVFQIIVAANIAACSKKQGRLVTKSLNTELLYNLSVSKNISQALTKFGVDGKDDNIVIAIFGENCESKFDQMKCHFEGEICDPEEISKLSDVELIKKTYKITERELEVSPLLDSVVSRISTKAFGSY